MSIHILLLGLMVVLTTFTSCFGRKAVVEDTVPPLGMPYYIDWVMSDSGYVAYSVCPPRWLYTDNSKYVADNWHTDINQDYYYDPEPYCDELGRLQVCDLYYISYVIDMLDSVRALSTGERDVHVEYVTESKYDRPDISLAYNLSPEELSDSIKDAFIGKLEVSMRITKIDGRDCDLRVKLLEHRLSEPTYYPFRDGLFLCLAQGYVDIHPFSGDMYLSRSYIDNIAGK